MHAHLSGDMCQDLVPILELNAEHGIGERLDDSPLNEDCVVLGLCQKNAPPAKLARLKRARRTWGDPSRYTSKGP